jgi:hypothetical protein
MIADSWWVRCELCGYLDPGWPRSGPAFAVRQFHIDLNPDHPVVVCKTTQRGSTNES